MHYANERSRIKCSRSEVVEGICEPLGAEGKDAGGVAPLRCGDDEDAAIGVEGRRFTNVFSNRSTKRREDGRTEGEC